MPKLFTPSNTAVQEASRLLDDLFGPVLTAKVADGDRLWLSTRREDLLRVAHILASEPALGLDYLSFVGGTDMQEYFEVLYYLYSFSRPLQVALKVRLPHDDPTVPSVSSLWPTANWHERETFDLVGITFTGHPDLRRILTAEGFTAHPLRKDFVTRAPSRDEVLEYIDVNLPDIK